MKKIYDVYFTLSESAVITVEADNENEAEEIFNNMTRGELLGYINYSVWHGGFEITKIEDVDSSV